MKFDRNIYFDKIKPLFGKFTQQQVDGQNIILSAWEKGPGLINDDLRHLAYPLAITYHECATKMWPIEEYNKGEGQEYGEIDPETKQTYYGRGFVQLTWRDNYRRATQELELDAHNDLEWHAERALDPVIASQVMFEGMTEGWFRSGHDLGRYFNKEVDDPFNAREIINGDKNYKAPKGAKEKTMGEYIANLHKAFLAALEAAVVGVTPPTAVVSVRIVKPPGVQVNVVVEDS